MVLTQPDRKAKLIRWISRKHRGQVIKGTTEPFFNHLKAVAEMAAPFVRFGYEVGLSHDLLEKTNITAVLFYQALTRFGYLPGEADAIISQVIELTDVFTKAAYPGLKKHERKELEEQRLAAVGPDAQTVKYADLICNIEWVLQYGQKNAASYLYRKRKLLLAMESGDPMLRQKAMNKVKSF
jgi:hypothetical protein